ncbi:MAG: 16S rRNA (cytidine(1402)-2'-O)-methyltransferase [Minisyncoccia bacterium]
MNNIANKGCLYVVATPIGNLNDITYRAINILKSVDVILAEDTRVTKKLLTNFQIHKPVFHYDDYCNENCWKKILFWLESNKNVAFVTDAGTPNISDPGYKLINSIRSSDKTIKIIPIPGPSAITTVLSVAGVNANQFTFVGFPPSKKGREKFFKALDKINIRPIILFESCHHLKKLFDDLQKFCYCKNIIVAKELTKIYEEIWQGTPAEAAKYFVDKKAQGEFVIIIF